jgi:hypothetical protein
MMTSRTAASRGEAEGDAYRTAQRFFHEHVSQQPTPAPSGRFRAAERFAHQQKLDATLRDLGPTCLLAAGASPTTVSLLSLLSDEQRSQLRARRKGVHCRSQAPLLWPRQRRALRWLDAATDGLPTCASAVRAHVWWWVGVGGLWVTLA